MSRDLDYVLDYMIKYTKDKFMQDSEPMLNHKDIEIVLKYINDLQQENKQLKEEKKKVWEWVIYKQQHSIEPIISTDELDEILEILGDKE